MASGGYRPNAGRPKKLDKNAGAVVKAEKQIRDNLPRIIDALLERAYGVQAIRETRLGDVVYNIPPDVKACTYLIDRILGSPLQKQEITGSEGGPLTVQHLAEPNYDAAVTDIAPRPIRNSSAQGED